jgi:hypothetical protein
MIMVEQQYIAPGLPQPDGLSGASNLHDSISTTTTSPYQDLASYTSVSYNSSQVDGSTGQETIPVPLPSPTTGD